MRWLKPFAPHVREVSALAAESPTPDELLERLCLRGMLPMHRCNDGIARVDVMGEETLALSSQPSKELLVKLGADGAAVAEIEALAAELRWRLRSWGVLGREGVCWAPLRTHPPDKGVRGELRAWLRSYVPSARMAAVEALVQIPPERWQWHRLRCEIVLTASAWDHSDEPVPIVEPCGAGASLR